MLQDCFLPIHNSFGNHIDSIRNKLRKNPTTDFDDFIFFTNL